MTAEVRWVASAFNGHSGDNFRRVRDALGYEPWDGTLWERVAESAKPKSRASSQAGLQSFVYHLGGPTSPNLPMSDVFES